MNRNNLQDFFLSDDRLTNIGSRRAIEFREQALTYNDLRQAVDACIERLLRFGVEAGDRVALLLYDSPDFIAYFLATVSLRAICVPINTFLSPEEVTFILSDSGAKLFIAEADLAEFSVLPGSDNVKGNLLSILVVSSEFEEGRGLRAISFQKLAGNTSNESIHLIASSVESNESISKSGLIESTESKESLFNSELIESEDSETGNRFDEDSQFAQTAPLVAPETPCLLLYTSGSTGTPKGALHSLGSLFATIDGFGADVLQLVDTDRVYSASRLYFAYGLGNSFSFPLAAGATTILDSRRPTPGVISEILTQRRPTIFFAVPAVYRSLLDLHKSGEPIQTESLRMCISAGEALPATLFSEWLETFGLTILDGIGSTEMLHMFISNRSGSAKAGSSGTPVKGYEAVILNDSGDPTPIGEQGNLWIRGASAMLGYWHREDLTSMVMRQGFMKTGDVYRQDEDGFYYHIGRSDDCFKVKGLWVSPVEIESVLLAHPEVIEAAVVAGKDENGLATAKAYLVIRKGSETLRKELYEFASARLAPYKTPTQYEFVKEMPRTSTGKIQRYKLRV